MTTDDQRIIMGIKPQSRALDTRLCSLSLAMLRGFKPPTVVHASEPLCGDAPLSGTTA